MAGKKEKMVKIENKLRNEKKMRMTSLEYGLQMSKNKKGKLHKRRIKVGRLSK